LAEDFPMLGFGGATVPRRPTLQSSNQIVAQITHMQVPSHRALMRSLISTISHCAMLVKICGRPSSVRVIAENFVESTRVG
jgi:hypothetical protein